jgi:hypothetical protein
MGRVRKAQEETQGLLMRCEVADESVVVMKPRPEKAGNSLEGKTGMTRRLVDGGRCVPKAAVECEGRKFIRRFLDSVLERRAGHKPPDRA